MLHEPSPTDTQTIEDDIDVSPNPEKTGWLRKLGENSVTITRVWFHHCAYK